ncbi:MAG: UGSC family (seleno)protein, partial [Rhodospirillales bacterium]
MPQMKVLNPKVFEEVSAVTVAGRLADLKGKRIGLVDNSKVNVGTFLSRLEERLRDEYGIEVTAKLRKLAPKDPLNDDEIESLSGCDAVIQCYGDCGTSTSMTVADAVVLEGKGIPTATVFSTAFSGAARQQAAGRGLTTLPLVEIPHPMHSAPKDLVLERADAAFDAIAKTLTSDDMISTLIVKAVPSSS